MPRSAPGLTVPAPDAALGSFSDDPPWLIDPDHITWLPGLDTERARVQAEVPELLRARRVPPGLRTGTVVGRLGLAIGTWMVRERGRASSRAGISRRLRVASERLGPTFIKLGQIISSGEGVFPEELVGQFKLLRDRVPAEDFADIRAVVEDDLEHPLEELFAEFDPTPLAAASIAQVHRAVLRRGPDGHPVEVVVKVQRPGISETVRKDIRALAWLAPFLIGRIPVTSLANPPALVELFAQTIVEELDFRLEAQNQLDIARSFTELGQTGYVVPRPHPEYVTRRVLVMERLDGYRFDDVTGIIDAGIDTQQIIRTGMIGFMEGCMIHGIFHGDLHGGNLFVQSDGRTALLDFGIVGRLDEHRRTAFLRLLVAGTSNDVRGQLAAVRDLGALPADVDLDAVIVDLGLDGPPIDPTTLTPDELVAELNRVVKALLGYGARMPKELMLFAKNMVFVDGAIATLAPDLDLFGEIAHLVAYFVTTHGARIASEVGLAPGDYEVDLTSVKGSLGVDPSTESLTYRELQQRRELIASRLERHTRARRRRRVFR